MNLDGLRLERCVERALAPWRGAGPGMTLGVVRGGALVVQRSAGMASVEHGVPIGPGTRFRIASVSKQFTTAAILMLAQDGLLDIEDPAAKHLPELAEAAPGVTVAHMMHNTSGIRDMLEIMRQGGADLGVPVTTAALLDGIHRQRTLNFVPGTRFLYSNSNFLLLGLIVERLSGEALPAFLERRIFAPLGMTATSMTPDVAVAVPGLATGYFPDGAGWRRAPHAFPLGGEGGLVSGIEDLALWDRNLGTGLVGGDWLTAALSRQTPFANGTENRYARGQVVRAYRGHATVSHGGLWPGYRTEFLRVPGLDVTVIAIANTGAADPNLVAHQVLDALLESVPGTAPMPPMPKRAALEAMAGRYLEDGGVATVDIAVNESGRTTLATNGLVVGAAPLADGRIASPRSSSVFAVRDVAPGVIEAEQDAGTVSRWHRVAPGAALPAGLAGRYRSAEMATDWTVTVSDDKAVVRSRGPVTAGGNWPLEPVEGDVVRVQVPGTLYQAWLDVRVVRDGGAVTGLEVHGGRAKKVMYRRVDDDARAA